MNLTAVDIRIAVLSALPEGMSIRATERMSPAMAAEVTDHMWSMREVLALLDERPAK